MVEWPSTSAQCPAPSTYSLLSEVVPRPCEVVPSCPVPTFHCPARSQMQAWPGRVGVGVEQRSWSGKGGFDRTLVKQDKGKRPKSGSLLGNKAGVRVGGLSWPPWPALAALDIALQKLPKNSDQEWNYIKNSTWRPWNSAPYPTLLYMLCIKSRLYKHSSSASSQSQHAGWMEAAIHRSQ